MRCPPVCRIWLLVVLCPAAAVAQVPIVNGTPTTETFNSLAVSGTSSTVPPGWAFLETDDNANGLYTAGTGSSNAGDTYSFGSTGSNERAFGGLLSGSLVPTLGAQLRNDTGAPLAQLVVAYTGEQWRLGTTGRTDTLQFQYSLNATSLGDGIWTAVPALDFVTPAPNGMVGATDGNAIQTGISATITGLNLAPAATLWVRWVDVNASSNDDGLAIDNVAFSPQGGGGDVPPAITATTPGNGAANVTPTASIVVTFSEAVTLTDPWFGIACTSGPRTATVAGGPSGWTLYPDTPFAFGDACTVTIVAAQVADQDGTPDAMAADFVFGFSVPQDTPPAVSGTVPADNATNVVPGANLSVTFSEPVAASMASFALACGGTLPYALTNTAQTTWTLDPAQPLPTQAACTLTVVAAQVMDLDGVADPLPADVVVDFTTGLPPSGYYASVDASSCQALRTTLHALIDDHTALSYSGAPPSTWDMLEVADQDPNDPGHILDVYRNRSYDKPERRAGGSTPNDGTYYNREHTWPNSLGFGSPTGNLGFPNAPYTDGHMLYLSATDWNSDRGNKPYADCPPPGCGARGTDAQLLPFDGGGGTCNHATGNCNWVQSPDGNSGSFEVWQQRKGDAARAMLYMDVRYEGGTATAGNTLGQSEPDLVLTDTRSLIQITSASPAYMGLRADILEWQAADLPTAHDVLRNDAIQTFQGNRNPFVDHPEWVAIAFAQPCGAAPPDLLMRDGFEDP
jgi:endonuclease I